VCRPARTAISGLTRVERWDFAAVVNAAPHEMATAGDFAGLPVALPDALPVADAATAVAPAAAVEAGEAGEVGVEDVADVEAQAGSASAHAAATTAARVGTRRDRTRMGITSGWRGPPVDVRCADRTGSSVVRTRREPNRLTPAPAADPRRARDGART
jgi:hypothetical protein